LGQYFVDQALAALALGAEAGVCYPDLRSLRTLSPSCIAENHFQWTCADDAGVHTVLLHGWNPLIPRIRARVFVEASLQAFRIYERRYGRPDIIHAQSVLWGGVAAMRLSRQTGIPYVVTEHSSAYHRKMNGRWKPWIVRCLGAAARTICVSSSLAHDVSAVVPDIPISVIPNMVDAGFFTLPRAPRVSPRHSFLTVANLNRNKGIDTLLEAFALYRRAGGPWTLNIGGQGLLRQRLMHQARHLHLEDAVHFLGPLTRMQVRQAMWEASAFVLVSRVETFGLAVVEALATGLPVVVTRCGGPEEFVTPDDGLLVEIDNRYALAEALTEIAKSRRPEDDEDGRNRCISRFGSSEVGRQLLDVYTQVVGSSGA
jgi:glycosyltransferase involved in cell wall biosynthesis